MANGVVGSPAAFLAEGENEVPDFADEILELSGVNVRRCCQCRKCSSSAAFFDRMDIHPAQIIEAILAGRREEVLSCGAIWLYTASQAVLARCPQGIDLVSVTNALRELAVGEKHQVMLKTHTNEHKRTLKLIRKHGRAEEIPLLEGMKIGHVLLTKHFERSLALLLKGKLPILPTRLADMRAVDALFRLDDEGAGS